MKRVLIIILLVEVIIVAGTFVYTRVRRAKSTAPTNYRTETLKKGSLVSSIGATGTVRTNQTTPVSWRISGRMGLTYVNESNLVVLNPPTAVTSAGSANGGN